MSSVGCVPDVSIRPELVVISFRRRADVGGKFPPELAGAVTICADLKSLLRLALAVSIREGRHIL